LKAYFYFSVQGYNVFLECTSLKVNKTQILKYAIIVLCWRTQRF